MNIEIDLDKIREILDQDLNNWDADLVAHYRAITNNKCSERFLEVHMSIHGYEARKKYKTKFENRKERLYQKTRFHR